MKDSYQPDGSLKANHNAEIESPDVNTVAWNGNLDVKLLRGKVKGEPLFAALQNRARQLGHTLQEMCKILDFSYPYYAQMRSGLRAVSGANEQFTAACALYLGVPRLTVLALADVVTPGDFYVKPNDLLNSLPAAFEFISSDPEWSHLFTAEVRAAEPSTQYVLVRFYEKMTSKRLLPEAIEPELLAGGIKKLWDIREGLLDDWDN